MIRKPPPPEALYIVYGGVLALAIALSLWAFFFIFKSWPIPSGGGFRLSFIGALDCLRIWNGQACADHFHNATGSLPAEVSRRQWIVTIAAFMGICGILIGGYLVAFVPRPMAIKAGRTVAGMSDLLKAAKREKIGKRSGLHWFNGWRLALDREVRHFMIFGSIGGGKTQAMLGLILSAIARRDKVLVLDIKGDFTAGLPDTKSPEGKSIRPILIAPQDGRSAVWDIAKDLIVAEDAIELAARLIPEGRDRFFSNSARAVLAACIIRLMHDKPRQWTWAELVAETQRPADELLKIAERYHKDAVRFLDADFRQVAATLSTLQADATTLRLLATAWQNYGDRHRFSLREWLLYKTEQRTVILQRSGRFAVQSDGWISAFLTIGAAIVADPELGDAPMRRIWFFLDEFAQLPKISKFSTFLDVGRSKGVCVCLGIQDIAQIRHTYGAEQADSWMSIVGTKLITRVNSGPTAQRLESDVGEATVIYYRRKDDGSGVRWDRDEKREYPFIRSEFETALGPRKKGIDVLVTGIGPDVYKIRIPYISLERHRPSQVPAGWTKELTIPGSPADEEAHHSEAEKEEEAEVAGDGRVYEPADMKHLEDLAEARKPEARQVSPKARPSSKIDDGKREPDLFDGI